MLENAAQQSASDEDLACRAQQGCAASFEQLLRRFQIPVLHFLRHRGLATDAEDVAQETFLRAYNNLHRYDRRWNFSAWLFTIARRLSINHYRRQQSTADPLPIHQAVTNAPEPLEALATAESRQRLWNIAADVLSEDQSTAIWLHYVEDMPLRGIARVLDRSPSSVKTLLHRARRKLLPLFAEFDEDRRQLTSLALREALHE
jgi:RNA polymerase sigma-70 factor (ECF subfamily)